MKFRALPTAYDEVRKKTILQAGVVVTLVFAIIVGPRVFSGDPTDLQSSLIAAVMFIVIFFVTITTRMKKRKERYLSTVVTIEDGVVTREQTGMRTVAIRSGEIVKIIRGPKGNIFVCGSSRTAQIMIPSEIENYDEMVSMLAALKPITENERDYSYVSVMILVVIVAMLVGDFVVENRVVNIISYSVTILLVAASFIIVQWSPLVEKRTKRISWLTLIPLLAFISMLIRLINGE